jgi:SAM-dependent methyltransferase
MRDPQGRITIGDSEVVRALNQPLPDSHFLRTDNARELVRQGRLIDFCWVDEQRIESPRIPFVTYPHEWCDDQLWDAAHLTLTLSEDIRQYGYELKDASAWNVLFFQGRPTYCDHLSFDKIDKAPWWAFGQFVRHFIFPLLLSKYRGMHGHQSFKLARDGLQPETVATMLGVRRFFSRYWLLTLGSLRSPSRSPSPLPQHGHPEKRKEGRKNLYVVTAWFLSDLKSQETKSAWHGYVDKRDHYSKEASGQKYGLVKAWLKELNPAWVVDLGCNTGEFSILAAGLGAQVVALDCDHECIQQLYRQAQGLAIYPVLATLDDLSAGRGWAGEEFTGLMGRLECRADVLLILALLHHLMASSSIPLEKIVEFAAALTKRHLIVELIHEDDPLLVSLSEQRNRSPRDFSLVNQSAAWARSFELLKQETLAGGLRSLALYMKK